jgi:phosphoribosylaminoimidazole-succinocarboxamide synthase
MALKQGLVLMDTKYEFGWDGDTLMLMDEIHTPDSSRYAYADDLLPGKPPRQLSKEFVREWLIQEGFQGKEGQTIPEMTDTVVQEIFNRYAELYTALTGQMPPKCSSISDQELKKTIETLCQ